MDTAGCVGSDIEKHAYISNKVVKLREKGQDYLRTVPLRSTNAFQHNSVNFEKLVR